MHWVAIRQCNYAKIVLADIKASLVMNWHRHSVVLGSSKIKPQVIFSHVSNTFDAIFKIDTLGCNQAMQPSQDCLFRHEG